MYLRHVLPDYKYAVLCYKHYAEKLVVWKEAYGSTSLFSDT
jgi:hypothetical protein